MYQVHYLNPISPKGTALWTDDYKTADAMADAQAIMVRSAQMHELELPEGLLAVARAGAGVNNIPLDRCADQGIVVFNTPGANANGVVEMAMCGMLLASRDVVGGIGWVKSIKDEGDVAKKVEKGKSKFAGNEIKGKKLGVIGLGAIGGPLANNALNLGMEVYGCDPFLSVNAAFQLDSRVKLVKTREEIFSQCDIISIHVPLLDSTRKMINADTIAMMPDGAIVLNFARDALVDDDAMEAALQSGKIRRYVTDFPNDRTAGMEGVIAIPHLGASTEESEDNCAKMAVRQVMDYLENGNIVNSVNFPAVDMGVCTKAARITVLHKSDCAATDVVAATGVTAADMASKTRGNYAYTVVDTDDDVSTVAEKLANLNGVLRVRIL